MQTINKTCLKHFIIFVTEGSARTLDDDNEDDEEGADARDGGQAPAKGGAAAQKPPPPPDPYAPQVESGPGFQSTTQQLPDGTMFGTIIAGPVGAPLGNY